MANSVLEDEILEGLDKVEANESKVVEAREALDWPRKSWKRHAARSPSRRKPSAETSHGKNKSLPRSKSACRLIFERTTNDSSKPKARTAWLLLGW